MRRFAVLVLLPLVLLGPLALRVESEEDPDEKLRLVQELMRRLQEAEEQAGAGEDLSKYFAEEGRLVLRVYNVADLTVRLTDFIAPNLEIKPAGAEVDEAEPLFGRAQEGEVFFAGAEELIDLLSMNVNPEIWEQRGYSMHLSGPHAIIVVADRETHDELTAYLGDLRESLGKMVTLELRLLELGAGALATLPAGPGAVELTREEGLGLIERAEAGDGMGIAHSVRLTGFNAQRVTLSRGAQLSFVQDYDVEVAQEAKISDPIVGVLQTGLAIDVRPTVRGEEQVILDLRVQIATLRQPLSLVETLSGPVQMPELGLTTVRTTVTVADRGFALVGASDSADSRSWALLLSPTIESVRAVRKGGAK